MKIFIKCQIDSWVRRWCPLSLSLTSLSVSCDQDNEHPHSITVTIIPVCVLNCLKLFDTDSSVTDMIRHLLQVGLLMELELVWCIDVGWLSSDYTTDYWGTEELRTELLLHAAPLFISHHRATSSHFSSFQPPFILFRKPREKSHLEILYYYPTSIHWNS